MMGSRFLDLVTTMHLVIPFLLVIPVSSFSTGSGEETCVTLSPNHDVNRPQTSPPPYTLEVSPTTFSPGQTITVTIVPEPNNLAAQTYRGISLQARRAGDSLLRATGIWTTPNTNFQYLSCLNSPQGTLTHTSAVDKTLPMTFQWTSPAGTFGNVFFSATILQNFETFWVDFRSQMVQDITVQPDPPMITCPMDVEVALPPGTTGSNVNFMGPTCVDPSNGQSLAVICSATSGSFFTAGSTSVNCFCTSLQQVTATCTFTVTVGSPPLIFCPSVMAMPVQGNNMGAFVTYGQPVCIDPQGGQVQSTCNMLSGSFFSAPQTTVTCTCSNMDGIEATCDFVVTLTGINTAPAITCPPSEEVTSLFGTFGNLVSFSAPNCTDAESLPGALTVTCNPMSGSLFQIGSNTVTCTCTDEGGLDDTCTFSVVVTAENIPPVIGNCPQAPISVDSQPNDIGAVVAYTTPTCIDTDNGGTIPTVICDPAPGSFVQGIGTRVGTCTCSDLAGDTDQCTFSYIINAANTPPVIRCPPQVVVESLAGDIGNNAMWPEPSCTDAEQTSGLLVSCIPMTGSFFPGVGDNLVTCTCTDNGGLVDTCTFAVIIQAPNVPPTITCPADVSTKVAVGTVGTLVTFGNPVCIDPDQNDENLVTLCNPPSNSFLQVGLNTVTCTCNDINGASDTCTFTVTVSGSNTAPSAPNCPSSSYMFSAPEGSITAVVDYGTISCSDVQQESITAICQPAAGSAFNVGSTIVACTCVDNGNLTSDCVFLLEVKESPGKFSSWFILVAFLVFFFGIASIVCIVLVLKRRMEKTQRTDIPMDVITNPNQPTELEAQRQANCIENEHISNHRGEEYLRNIYLQGSWERNYSVITQNNGHSYQTVD